MMDSAREGLEGEGRVRCAMLNMLNMNTCYVEVEQILKGREVDILVIQETRLKPAAGGRMTRGARRQNYNLHQAIERDGDIVVAIAVNVGVQRKRLCFEKVLGTTLGDDWLYKHRVVLIRVD